MTPFTNHICGPFEIVEKDGRVVGVVENPIRTAITLHNDRFRCQSCHKLYVVKDGRLEPAISVLPEHIAHVSSMSDELLLAIINQRRDEGTRPPTPDPVLPTFANAMNDLMQAPPVATPRTDKLIEFDRLFRYLDYARVDAPRNTIDPYSHEGSYSFHDLRKIRDFARTLERDLAARDAELERWRTSGAQVIGDGLEVVVKGTEDELTQARITISDLTSTIEAEREASARLVQERDEVRAQLEALKTSDSAYGLEVMKCRAMAQSTDDPSTIVESLLAKLHEINAELARVTAERDEASVDRDSFKDQAGTALLAKGELKAQLAQARSELERIQSFLSDGAGRPFHDGTLYEQVVESRTEVERERRAVESELETAKRERHMALRDTSRKYPIAVAAAVIISDGKVLLERRAPTGVIGLDGMWDLPGGKIECGETASAAVVREISEELGLNVSATRQIPNVLNSVWEYPEKGVRHWLIIPFLCEIVEGIPLLTENLQWFDVKALPDNLLKSDREILTAAQ